MSPLLEIDDVVVEYGGLRAVDRVSFTLAHGEIVGFIGANGSGKTTLLDAISGQVKPRDGRVAFDGVDLVDHLPEDRATLGLVRSFQDCRLYPELTVEETLLVAHDVRTPVGVFSSALTLPRARRRELEKRAAVDRLLTSLGLEQFRHNLVEELSTGTRRIVDLATIITADPKVLLLDEPTAGIAQREAEAFGPLLERLHALTGAAICLVEHDVPLVMSLCDRVIVMEAGRIVTSGAPQEVMNDPEAIAAYLGASEEALRRSGLALPARRTKRKRKKEATTKAKEPKQKRAPRARSRSSSERRAARRSGSSRRAPTSSASRNSSTRRSAPRTGTKTPAKKRPAAGSVKESGARPTKSSGTGARQGTRAKRSPKQRPEK